MFKGISTFFANMKVGRKLSYGFGTVVVITVLVGIASLLADIARANALETVVSEKDQVTYSYRILSETVIAEEEALLFDLNWKAEGYDVAYADYIVLSQEHANNALAAVDEALAIAEDDEEIETLNTVRETIETFSGGVLELAEMHKTHGHITTGIEGELHTASEAFEDGLRDRAVVTADPEASGPGRAEVLEIFHDVHDNEKEYQAHGGDEFVQAVHENYDRLTQAINASSAYSGSDKQTLLQMGEDYISSFDRLVEMDTQIVEKQIDQSITADEIEPILSEMAEEQNAEQLASLDDYHAAQTTGRIAQGTFVVIAALAAIGLSVVIAQSLTGQIAEVQKLFRAAAIGNFSMRARVLSHDELGQTAEGVNAMLERLTDFMGRAAQIAQQRFSDVVTTLSDWVWETDLKGNYIFASDQLFDRSGFQRDEVLNRSMLSMIAPEDQDRLLDAVNQALGSKTPFTDLEVMAVDKAGNRFSVSLSGIVVTDDEGHVQGLRGTGRDITQRKMSENAVRESEQLLRSIINTTQDWIFLKDTNYRFLVVNEVFANIYGNLTPEEMVGKDDYELGTPAHLIEGDPARGIRGFRTDDREVIEQQRTITNPYDVVGLADGEHVFHTVKTPLFGAGGEVIGVLGIARDITERRHIEEQIEQRNAELATTLGELRSLIAGVETAAGQVTGASSSLQGVIQTIANDASSSASVAGQAAGSAHEGEQAVTETISAMGRIRETTQETARRIKKLGEVSQEIGEVVRLIDEIADRVTVLALNASIQAAAAGDAGRGFAVVAEEVQRLAERAAGATRQIENLIKGVQGEINEAMVSVEEVTQEVVGGSQLAQNAGERMSELNHTVGELSNLIQNIAQTTTRQTSESLVTLANLAENLQASVAALRTPEGEASGGNGHGNGSQVR